MTTVIYHSADFDGLFCREIAKKFLGTENVEYIGWDHGNAPLAVPASDVIYVMDLPIDTVFGLRNPIKGVDAEAGLAWDFIGSNQTCIWIDHHKSAIATHPEEIPGYRIDGVAACRLAWQWFLLHEAWDTRELYPPGDLPGLKDFIDRTVSEPLAVRLAGEYDIWDKRDPNVDVFQMGLRSVTMSNENWSILLESKAYTGAERSDLITRLLANGRLIGDYQKEADAFKMKSGAFLVEFEGLKFLALNSPAKSSMQFASMDVPETGHDALMKFNYNGKVWDFSLYHAVHRKDIDLSKIATHYRGGGHAGACGFRAQEVEFMDGSNGSKFLYATPL